jgi:hypothetical protein
VGWRAVGSPRHDASTDYSVIGSLGLGRKLVGVRLQFSRARRPETHGLISHVTAPPPKADGVATLMRKSVDTQGNVGLERFVLELAKGAEGQYITGKEAPQGMASALNSRGGGG